MKFLCMPSPASNRSNSRPLINATDDKPRWIVGAAADVPRKTNRIFTIVDKSLCSVLEFFYAKVYIHLCSKALDFEFMMMS